MSNLEPDLQQRAAERASTLLASLGWEPLSASDALALRRGRRDEPLLVTVLEERLEALNSFDYQGQQYLPGNASIAVAVQALQHGLQEEPGHANEQIWSSLKIGTPVRERLDGNTRSFTMRYVDWHNPANNRYHFVERFPVAGPSVTGTPDVVLFVNGIPFVVIELKSPRAGDDRRQPIEEAISQLQRYQRAQDIPQLFHYAQLLLAVSAQAAAYGVVGASREHWMEWHETPEEAVGLRDLIESVAHPPSRFDTASLLNEQDRLLHALCRPARLLDLVHWFTFFQNGRRIIARHHQFAAVQAVLKEITTAQIEGRQPGGVVWHAQGSGKSFTMVMLARVLLDALPGEKTRVLAVTDRGELDDQIYRNLRTAGIDCRRASTGRELLHLLSDPRVRAVTTVIQKFGSAANSDVLIADSPDIFVLVDEAHRTQSAKLASLMRLMLPRACFIGFTGTPVSRTLEAFGPVLATHSFHDAIANRTLVPLYWQQHLPSIWPHYELDLMEHFEDPESVDEDFEALAFKKSTVFETSERIRTVAESISAHFTEHFSGTPLKGLVVAPSRVSAVRFKQCLDKIGTVSSEVMVSFEDLAYSSGPSLLQESRQTLIQKFGSEARYEADVLRRFSDSDQPKLLIVVERFLTSLDAPRVAALYITRPMRGHRMLQAMARVNRSYQGKNHGLVVDYVGLHQELKELAFAYGSDLGIGDELKQPIWEPKPAPTEAPRRIRKSPAALELACEKILRQELEPFPWSIDPSVVEDAAAQISDAILSRRKVDWATDIDVQNQMMTAIEDVLFDLQAEQGVPLPLKSIDSIMVACVAVAQEIAA